jgi:hypothetical protein
VTDTDVFAVVSSLVWVVGLGLGYGIGYLGGSTRSKERARLSPLRVTRPPLVSWRRSRPTPDGRPGRVVSPGSVAPSRLAFARRPVQRTRMSPPR